MRAIDFRNATFTEVKDRLLDSEWRAKVYFKLLALGPSTTRQVAVALGREVHAIRPRVTELYQHGFVALLESPDPRPETPSPVGHEGIYFARTPEQFEVWRAAQPQMEISGQLQMPLREDRTGLTGLTG